MIALFDTPPNHCPQCGRPVHYLLAAALREALAGVAQVCPACGGRWAVVAVEHITAAALADAQQRLVDLSHELTAPPRSWWARWLWWWRPGTILPLP